MTIDPTLPIPNLKTERTSRIRSTFLTGLIALLPLIVTFAVIEWVALKILQMIGPNSVLGHLFSAEGGLLIGKAHTFIAYAIGFLITVFIIGILGLLAKTKLRARIAPLIERELLRLPLIGSIYRPAARIVNILSQDGDADLRSMSVVTCYPYGRDGAASFALLTSRRSFKVNGVDHRMVFLPHAPVPMTGVLVMMPKEALTPVLDMNVDELLQLNVSLGLVSKPSSTDTSPADHSP